ncbi:MAG: YjbQ family protein [Desulfurobacterium sp.]|nr:MAG: YjbQ family protein [Desulfurobacterium sp.]
MVYEISLKTTGRTQFVDITRQVESVILQSGVKNGICVIYVPHTTAAVTINENADPTVKKDIKTMLDKLIPWRESFYEHAEGNSAAHIKSSLIGCSETVIVQDGRLLLGTWQGIFFCEFDGPRTRKVYVKVIAG